MRKMPRPMILLCTAMPASSCRPRPRRHRPSAAAAFLATCDEAYDNDGGPIFGDKITCNKEDGGRLMEDIADATRGGRDVPVTISPPSMTGVVISASRRPIATRCRPSALSSLSLSAYRGASSSSSSSSSTMTARPLVVCGPSGVGKGGHDHIAFHRGPRQRLRRRPRPIGTTSTHDRPPHVRLPSRSPAGGGRRRALQLR